VKHLRPLQHPVSAIALAALLVAGAACDEGHVESVQPPPLESAFRKVVLDPDRVDVPLEPPQVLDRVVAHGQAGRPVGREGRQPPAELELAHALTPAFDAGSTYPLRAGPASRPRGCLPRLG